MLAHLIQIAEWVTDIAFPGALLSGPATFSALPRIARVAPFLWLSLVLVESARRHQMRRVRCACRPVAGRGMGTSARDGRGRGRLAHPRRDSFAASRYEPTAMSELQPRLAMFRAGR